MSKVGDVKEIYEKKGAGCSIRGIADELGIARNAVRRYLRIPEAMRPGPRPLRGSNPAASSGGPVCGIHRQADGRGVENCRVLQRELRALGDEGSYTILAEYVRPRRRGRQPKATVRFDTAPGERARAGPGWRFSRRRVQLPRKRPPAGRRRTPGRQGVGDGGRCKFALCSLPSRIMPSARRCSREMSTAPVRRSPAGWKCPLRRPLGPVQLASTSAERVQHSPRCSTGWTKSVRHSGAGKVKGEIR